MKGDIVPDIDHVAHLCKGSHIDPDTGEPTATAFMLRPGEESLSVNWVEFLALSNRDDEIKALRAVYGSKLIVGKTAKIAVFNVGKARDEVCKGTPSRLVIPILHDPDEEPGKWEDPSHSGIYNLPRSDNTAAELLACIVHEVHPAQ